MPCARQPLHGVVGVDPRVHAFGGRELGARRPQFGRERRNEPTEEPESAGRMKSEGRSLETSYDLHVIYRLVTPAALREALARFPVAAARRRRRRSVEPLPRLSALLGGGPRLFIKRDDAIPFGFGGNKVRKLALVGARAQADGADTLITAGGVQSNHARATAATAAKLGMRAVLVANGAAPERLDRERAARRAARRRGRLRRRRASDRAPAMLEIAERLRARGTARRSRFRSARRRRSARSRFALAVAELVDQMPAPDVIVHATSSGGTQAGLVAGCRLLGLPTRVVGVSADDTAPSLQAQVRAIVSGIADLLEIWTR